MRISTLLSASAIVLLVGSGSALAGEQTVSADDGAPVLLSDYELGTIVAGDQLQIISGRIPQSPLVSELPDGTFDALLDTQNDGNTIDRQTPNAAIIYSAE